MEVTIENLNDNVDKQFLHQMVAKFGTYEEMHIYYHPTKRKHLGLARLVFEEVGLGVYLSGLMDFLTNVLIVARSVPRSSAWPTSTRSL